MSTFLQFVIRKNKHQVNTATLVWAIPANKLFYAVDVLTKLIFEIDTSALINIVFEVLASVLFVKLALITTNY